MLEKTLKLTVFCAFFCALAACSGQTPAPQKTQAAPSPEPFVPLGADELMHRIGKLPAQQLAVNECGLFLWLKREDTPLVFFQRATGEAVMALDGSQAPLTRGKYESPIAFEYFKTQAFAHNDMNIILSIEPEALRTLQKGRKVPAGKISITTEAGWGASLPVAGVIACK